MAGRVAGIAPAHTVTHSRNGYTIQTGSVLASSYSSFASLQQHWPRKQKRMKTIDLLISGCLESKQVRSGAQNSRICPDLSVGARNRSHR